MLATEPMETVHIYYEYEEPKQPFTRIPLLFAFLCLGMMAALTVYSAQHPYYEHQQLTVPAKLLSLKVFTAQAPIIPTGVESYPATTAHGTLTITNGSIIGQFIPAGFTIQDVATDRAVYVPPGSADGYGYATVLAHALVSGAPGNIPAYSINQVEGSSVYIRNQGAFYGGRNSYSVKFVSSIDRNVALSKARTILTSNVTGLHYPCSENHFRGVVKMVLTWHCQFVTYHVPSYMRVLRVRLSGKNLLVDVAFAPPPVRIWAK